ncbi:MULTISPECIES: hypothetical protein [unclassified Paenibacillus]|uniref:hypothetical protein n=1 Tax=unclassified Paenibacillus TaxID=185978 RepID=UPI00301B55CE
MKRLIVLFTCVSIVFMATACQSESDKRKARIDQLQTEIDEANKKTEMYDRMLDAYDKQGTDDPIILGK